MAVIDLWVVGQRRRTFAREGSDTDLVGETWTTCLAGIDCCRTSWYDPRYEVVSIASGR